MGRGFDIDKRVWPFLSLIVPPSVVANSRDFDAMLPHYVNLDNIFGVYTTINMFSILILAMSILNIFKFLQGNTKISKIWQTLDRAKGILGAYIFLFLVVISSSVLIAHFEFGYELREFSR